MRARSQHGSVEIIVQKAAFGLAVFFHMRRSAAHWRGAAGWRKVPDQAAWEVLRSAQRSHRTLKRLEHQTGTAASPLEAATGFAARPLIGAVRIETSLGD